MSLYEGAMPFLATYCIAFGLQFTIYEKTMDFFKAYYDAENFKKRELPINTFAGFLGGVIGAGMTNAFECVTVAKQTNPDCNMTELIKKERFSLLTKGLLARV